MVSRHQTHRVGPLPAQHEQSIVLSETVAITREITPKGTVQCMSDALGVSRSMVESARDNLT